MGYEIEVKVRVKDEDFNRVGGLLSSHPGFVKMRKVCKDDIYWGREEGQNVFRTRFETIDSESHVLFTSKPSKKYENTELNEENEFTACDVDRLEMENFIKSIGYKVVMLKKKDGYDFAICLDDRTVNAELLKVRTLDGWFLECEITYSDEPDPEEKKLAQSTLLKLLDYCGYNEKDLERRTYKKLLGYDKEAKETMKKEELVIYTDGGCSGNPGPGGWAFAVQASDNLQGFSGTDKSTTNNKMELTAVIKALSYALEKGHGKVTVLTDSQYVKNGINSWIYSWKQNGWKTASKDNVKNKELWIELDELRRKLDVDWKWVKGHAGVAGNELCDSLVRKETAKWL